MNTRTLIICAGIILLAISVAFADDPFPKVINFEGAIDGGGSKDIFPSTYTGQVSFQHVKHFKDYVAECGDCHHDNEGNPIAGYNSDSRANLACGTCHSEKGLIRGPIAENAASSDDLIAHRANALHMLCMGCHTKHNVKEHLIIAPVACRTCHAKRPQDWILE